MNKINISDKLIIDTSNLNLISELQFGNQSEFYNLCSTFEKISKESEKCNIFVGPSKPRF